MTSRGTRTLVTTEEVMGTVVSIHVIVSDDGGAGAARNAQKCEAAVGGFLATMHADDAMFSPFKATSAVSRIKDGTLTPDDAPQLVRDVEAACLAAREATAGRFDAWWQGWFDPTGYVKGWSVERAFTAHLLRLVRTDDAAPGALSVGVSAGGDLRVATRDGVNRPWRIGVADPHDASRTLATLELTEGAVATSGTTQRGEHVIDPTSGTAATTVVSATVVADTLDVADLWATTALVAGFDDLTWIADAPTQSGLLIAADGRTRRWAGIAELTDAEPQLP